ncbi:GntR family transcriptional regulator [Elioraea sp.]|uniref:GntR family transcriptional regulator n=1 Tax=Elioraea sp. TaxID=2185103 RepID=UPI0025BF79F0|nr:GntR family transcriptional regulator [Elioraea sp.]
MIERGPEPAASALPAGRGAAQVSLTDSAGPIAPQLLRLLRETIVKGELLPGSIVSEADIARRYGVSRQPVREAFIKLQEAGLLSIRPQRGTVVLRISVDAVYDARFVREAVEVAVVRACAAQRPEGLARRLADLIAAQEEAAGGDNAPGFLRLDEAFHRALAEGIGRSFAWTALEAIKAQMDRVRFLSFEGATPLPELIRQHRAIAGAVAAGAVDEAETAMRAHLREILASLPRIAQAHPDYFEPAPGGRAATRKEDTP